MKTELDEASREQARDAILDCLRAHRVSGASAPMLADMSSGVAAEAIRAQLPRMVEDGEIVRLTSSFGPRYYLADPEPFGAEMPEPHQAPLCSARGVLPAVRDGYCSPCHPEEETPIIAAGPARDDPFEASPNPIRTIKEHEEIMARQTKSSPDKPPIKQPIHFVQPEKPQLRARMIATGLIQESPLNPRQEFDADELESLAESIKANGILEPLVVRDLGLNDLPDPRDQSRHYYYEIIAGARRYRAARLARIFEVPCIIRDDVSDETALELMIIENDERADLKPLERARAYQKLIDAGYTQGQVATKTHRSQPAIAQALALLALPLDVQSLIDAGDLTPRHGQVLRRWEGFPAVMSGLAQVAVRDRMTATQLETDSDANSLNRVVGTEHSGAVHRFGWNEPFRYQHVCEQCPHGAYRPGSSYASSFCLRPDHYRELVAEAEARAEMEAEAAREDIARSERSCAPNTPGSTAGDVLALKDLKPASYDVIAYNPLAGCTAECPCRARALDRQNKLVEICTDPARRKSLRSQETRAKNKADREHRARAVEAATANLKTPHPAILSRCVAALFREFQGSDGWDPALQEAAQELGITLPRLNIKTLSGHEGRLATMRAVASLPLSQIIRLIGWRAVRESVANVERGYSAHATVAEFLAEELPGGEDA